MFLVLSTGCAPVTASTREENSLTVLAAASLTEAFQELAPLFEEANPGVNISFNFAGSQQLAQQLANGAPGDVFASANQKQMDVVIDRGRIEPGSAQIFARNRLVVIYPKQNPAGLKDLQDLARPGLKLILASREVPVGQYSLDFLAKASSDGFFSDDYLDAVLANVVSYEENVRAVLTKVALGEADAGIVYTSDITTNAAAQVGQLTIPDEWNLIGAYPIAVIADSRSPALAQAFVDLVQSDQGQRTLEKYGFMPARED